METKSTREEELLRLSLFLLKVVEASHETLMVLFTEEEKLVERDLFEQVLEKVREYLKGDYPHEQESKGKKKGKAKRFTH